MLNHAINAAAGLINEAIDPVTDCQSYSTDPEICILGGQETDSRVWPDDDYENENNHSLVIRVDFGQASLLLTGGLEEKGWPGDVAQILKPPI